MIFRGLALREKQAPQIVEKIDQGDQRMKPDPEKHANPTQRSFLMSIT